MFLSAKKRAFLFVCALMCLFLICPPSHAQFFRPSKEVRTINTEFYEVSIQKNGLTDIRFVSGELVFDNLVPLVQYADSEEPEALEVDARYTARAEVNDRLGKGQGMMFSKKNCQWFIRAYPSKPFLTAQVIYYNDKKTPVRISKLIPWSVGVTRPGAAFLGQNAEMTQILENGRLFKTFNDYAEVVSGKSFSQWNMAAYNPSSRQTLIAGFLTNERAYTQVTMERREGAVNNGFDLFLAECVYDPPIEVPPQGTLESEIFYISIGETKPLVGLDRFGKAMAVWNRVRDERPFMPHGWDSWSTALHSDINETMILQNLDVVDKQLKRYGWNHFAIDAGWERAEGDWEPHPERFPNGMKAVADEIHRRGMTAGLWIDPFTVPKNAPLAAQHPEWLVAPHGLGRIVMGNNKLILDVTIPAAYDYVKALAHKLGPEWGFDALVEADFVYHLMFAEKYANAQLTRIEVMRLGMKALREGFGEDRFITTMTPQPVNGVVAEGIRIGRDCSPVWRCGDIQQPWGAVESLTNAIRRFYFSPHLYVPDSDCAFFGHEDTRKRWNVQDKPALTPDQSVAWLTGAALTGGMVKIGDAFTTLSAQEIGTMRKLLPSVQRPAKPIDLFQSDSPAIWSLPMNGPAGEWHIVGVFNWDEKQSKTIPIALEDLGLESAAYYTVYDFWLEKYYGTVQGRLEIAVPPGAVRLLGLRLFEDRPMFLATNRHFTQGALDHKSILWDAATRQLRGTFDAVDDTDYTLRILAPPPYAFQKAMVGDLPVQSAVDGQVVSLSFHCPVPGALQWCLQF